MSTVTLIDQLTGKEYPVALSAVADTVIPWFYKAQEDVISKIHDFQKAIVLVELDKLSELCDYLAIDVRYVA